MESKFTKGNWVLGDENNSSCDISLPNGSDISLSRYERNTGQFVMERDEMNANWRLVCAAPKLLEALQKVYKLAKQAGLLEDLDLEEHDYISAAITAALGTKGGDGE